MERFVSYKRPLRNRNLPRPSQADPYDGIPRAGQHRKTTDFIALAALLAVMAVCVAVLPRFTSPAYHPSDSAGSPKPGESDKAGTDANAAAPGIYQPNMPVISEVSNNNKGAITAEDGRYYDWIEIYNPTQKKINLAGFALSDNLKKPFKFIFPSYILDPGKYVIVFASGMKSANSELHASFRLKGAGSPLLFTDSNGKEIQMLNVPKMEKNDSFAMDSSDPAKWVTAGKCTPGFPNTDEGYSAYQQTQHTAAPIYINEIMPGNTMTLKDEDGDSSDWIELYNPTDKAVDLTGWGLSDKTDEPKRWSFPKMEIQPGQYLVVFASGKNRSVSGKELHTDFGLDSYKGAVLLSNFRGQIVSEVQYSDLKPDTTLGLIPGTDRWQPFSQPTPGQPNNGNGWNAFQLALYKDNGSPVQIAAVMSKNTSTVQNGNGEYPDWIELHNRSDKSVNLKGYGLTNKADEPGLWAFPDVTMAPGQYLSVFAAGPSVNGGGSASAGELDANFKLSAGDAVVLTNPDGSIADRCFLPPLKADMAYGRVRGEQVFSYITDIKPGEEIKSGYPGITPDTVFDLKAGSYDKAQKVSLSAGDPEARIYYTTDGSAPTKDSTPYTKPIDLAGTTVVRAVTLRDGYLPGNPVSQTFFINAKHTLPVISISTAPKNLFDSVTGIYMPGPNASKDPKKFMEGANFYKNTEVPASFEVYNESGKRVFGQDIGLSMAGGLGLIKNQKTLAVHARSEYGQSAMNYKFFDNRPYDEYKSLVLRTNRDKSKIRESVIFGLVDGQMDVLVQAYKPYVVYINGQYWGVYNLMEKRNKYMVAQHEGASEPDNMDILKGSGGIVSHGSNTEYKNLVKYVKTHDMSQKENFDYVAARFDTGSFMDVMINLIYTANTDYYNMQYYKLPNGKWKQILYDTELTFQNANHQTLSARMGDTCNSDMFNALLKYKPWRDGFIERFAWAIKEIYNPGRVNAAIDKAAHDIQGEIEAMHDKFGDTATVNEWNSQITQMHTFANQRPSAMVKQLKSAFSLTDAQKKMLDDAMTPLSS